MRIYFLILSLPLFSLPIHPQFMNGGGEVLPIDAGLQINAADKSIIHWESFDIGPSELVHFALPTEQSIVLNRVLTERPSQILGRVVSNGGVVLLNPSGILVGKGARIDTARWIASTLDLQNESFLDQSWQFGGSSTAPICIDGRVQAEKVEFFGKELFISGELLGKEISLTGAQIDLSGHVSTPRDGKVMAIADEICNFYGNIYSPNGFVELSGHKDLICKGRVDTDKTGTLLLDPNEITINAVGPTNPAPLTPFYDGSPAVSAVILDSDLIALLGGSSVIIQTNSGIAGGSGNITVDAGISWASGTDLTLRADHSIFINATISPLGSGSILTFLATNGDIVIQSSPGVPAGVITAGLYPAGTAAINVMCPNGSFTIQAALDTQTLLDAGNIVSSGDVRVVANSLDIVAGPSATTNSNAGIITRRGDVYINISGPCNFTGADGPSIAFEAGATIVAGVSPMMGPLDGNVYFDVGSLNFNSTLAVSGVRTGTALSAYGSTVGFGILSGVVRGDVLFQSGSPLGCGAGLSTLGGGDINVAILGNLTMISNSGPTVMFCGTGLNTNIFPGSAGNGNINASIGGDLIAICGGGAGAGSGFDALGNLNLSVEGSALLQVTSGTGPESGVGLRAANGSIQMIANEAVFQGNMGTPLASMILAGGNISITTSQGLTLDHAFLSSTGGAATLQSAANSISVLNGTTMTAANQLLARAAQNINMESSFASSILDGVVFVVDDAFPAPNVGPGALFIDSSSILTSAAPIKLYTARQSQNVLLGTFNGALFNAGALFVDTPSEIWCIYYPDGLSTDPFTVFYKECLNQLAYQATLSIDENLRNMHPYDEYPGWFQEFHLITDDSSTPYLLRRRHIWLNQPKSWTMIRAI